MGNKRLDAGSIAVAVNTQMIRSAEITIIYADNTKKKTKISVGDSVTVRSLVDQSLTRITGNVVKIYESDDGTKAEQIKIDYSVRSQTHTIVLPVTDIKDASNLSCPDYDKYYDKYDNEIVDDSLVEEQPNEDGEITILSVKDITLEQASDLPDEVICTLSDGTERAIDVENWDEEASTEFVGTSMVSVILEGNTYNVKLIVVTASTPPTGDDDTDTAIISSVMPITLYLGDNLPNTITVIKSDNTEENITDFNWGAGASTTRLGQRTAKVLINRVSYDVTLNIIERPIVNTIRSIKPVTVQQGADLPTTVTAIMSNDTEQVFNVSWGVGTNTSTVGTRNVNVIIDNNIYQVSFTVNEIPAPTIVSVNDVTVSQGSLLPNKVTAVMSDGSSKEFNCSWTPSATTLTVGSSVVYVIIDGEDYAVKLTVTEVPSQDLVTISSIPDVTIDVNTELPTSLTVLLSNNTQTTKSVTWVESIETSEAKTFNTSVTIDGSNYPVKLIIREAQVVEEATITSIKDININKNSEAPSTVTAIMSDGSEQSVDVESWGEELDLTSIGTNNVEVTVNGQVYTVSVTVSEPILETASIVSVKPITVDKASEMPSQVTVVMSDETEDVVSVQQWDEAFVLADQEVGETTVSVIIEGESYNVTVTITDNTSTSPEVTE